jgi:DNA-binding transcriptional ArsR family regulator
LPKPGDGDPPEARSDGRDQQPASISREAVFKAIGHPLRIEVLRAFSGGAESPATLSRALRASVTEVAYHVRVLDRECKILEPVDDRRGTRAGQRFYRLKSLIRFSSLELDALPAVGQQGVVATLLGQFVKLASMAITSGTIGGPRGQILSARPGVFDEDGWRRANSVLRAADEEIEMIEGESRERLKATAYNGAVHAVVGLALFEAA